ncbi:Alpha-tocopherol transfer protein [Fasciolopsis buskii]|uniref:Alpha-tocopherol transfer protein n=1 Tax=Fasciolopsis buskii TaxID=27845 RepID=A0A8E0S397_9TREM|nr:Alpha-tocopherol transfer protein [Fasciolopsis buski]
MRTMNNMNFERCMFDERCQIGGLALVIDMSSTSMEQASQWADIKNSKSAFKLLQEGSPGRVKHLIFYKESKIFDFAFRLTEMWISDKMRHRILRVKDDMNKAFKKIPGLKDVLPIEYGGTCGDTRSAVENCRLEFKAFYSKSYPLKDISVDESKRPESAKNYMKEYKEVDNSIMGSTGTYVKIDPGD